MQRFTIYVFKPEGGGYVVYAQERIRTGCVHGTRPGEMTTTGTTFPNTRKGWDAAMDHVGVLNAAVASRLR